MVLSEEIVSFGSLPVYGNLEIVTTQIFLPVENIWSFSTVSANNRLSVNYDGQQRNDPLQTSTGQDSGLVLSKVVRW